MNNPSKIAWDPRASAAENGRRFLPRLLHEYFALGRELLAADPAPAQLHALRLATKRVRYTLELFKPVYGPGLLDRIAALRALQQILGEINDTAAGQRVLTQIFPESIPQRDRVIQFLTELGASKAAEFRRHWAETFDAPGRERWWTDYLSRPTATRVRQTSRPGRGLKRLKVPKL